MSVGWFDELLDELVAQLMAHPRLDALVQARVEQAQLFTTPRGSHSTPR